MKEGDQISPELLDAQWNAVNLHYDQMIDENLKLRPIRFLLRHIIKSGLSKKLVAGTSMYNLLISLPNQGKVDYSRTLKIEIDHLRSSVKLDYRVSGQKVWSDTCQLTEVEESFKGFVFEHQEWT